MPTLPPNVFYQSDKYRIILTENGTCRLQVRRRRSLKDLIKRRSKWRTLIVQFDDPNYLRIRILVHETRAYYAMKAWEACRS